MLPSKPAPHNKVIVTWNHGFQHTFISVGNALTGHLKALEGLEYVKEVMHYEITKEEYEDFYSMTLDTVESPEKKSRGKKGLPAFSSLENFFGEQKVPVKKSRRK